MNIESRCGHAGYKEDSSRFQNTRVLPSASGVQLFVSFEYTFLFQFNETSSPLDTLPTVVSFRSIATWLPRTSFIQPSHQASSQETPLPALDTFARLGKVSSHALSNLYSIDDMSQMHDLQSFDLPGSINCPFTRGLTNRLS